jgi:GMP synthase-like glutamine amidotransferase
MDVLSVVHGEQVRAGVFGDAVEARGHRLEEWSLAWGTPPARPVDDYGAVLVFGGAMHADQEDQHPWLREERTFLQRLIGSGTPTLGVCLGAQLLAQAAGAAVAPAPEPEIGWHPVELTAEAPDDPVLHVLPPRFDAFQWHYYAHELPSGAVELARNDVCTQAFRLGENTWGVQFHPEVTLTQVESWMTDDEPIPDGLLAETRTRIGAWNELGKQLCGAFVIAAEHAAKATAGVRPHSGSDPVRAGA